MSTPYQLAALAALVCLLPTPSTEAATVIFQDNFDNGQSGGSWDVWRSGNDSVADFAYDYSAIGIPSAPNSTGGTTVGAQFLVNQSEGVFQGISASPRDVQITGDFTIRFDLWINFVGPLTLGGSGSTQMANFGWGTNGTRVQWAASNHSIGFSASGDGGTRQDYRVYRAAGGAPMAPDTGVYAAGTLAEPSPGLDSRNNTDPYYASLGGKTAPAAQLALFPNQTEATSPGTLGMAWRDVVIEKSGEVITWTVDGLRIATVPLQDVSVGGDNLFLGMFDINAASSTDPNDFLNTAIYDNLRVSQVPEPSTFLLLGLTALVVGCKRRRH